MNTDLIAGLLSLLALMVIGAIYTFAGHQIVSQDLQAALGAFVVAALARWRLGKPKKAPHTPPKPVKTPTLADLMAEAKTPEDGAQASVETEDAGDDSEDAGDDGEDIFDENAVTPPRKGDE